MLTRDQTRVLQVHRARLQSAQLRRPHRLYTKGRSVKWWRNRRVRSNASSVQRRSANGLSGSSRRRLRPVRARRPKSRGNARQLARARSFYAMCEPRAASSSVCLLHDLRGRQPLRQSSGSGSSRRRRQPTVLRTRCARVRRHHVHSGLKPFRKNWKSRRRRKYASGKKSRTSAR
jgi:hypothetical protein